MIILAAAFLNSFFLALAYPDDADELKVKAEELYHTHHLAPGRFEQAIEAYEKVLAMRPNDYKVLWKLSEMHEVRAEMLGEKDRQRRVALWKKGIEYGKSAIEADPKGKEGHFYYMANMGALARTEGGVALVWRFRAIKKEMDKTLELDPNYAPGLVARAQYLTEMPGVLGGDDEEALRLYKRALESDPTFTIAYYYMAQIHARHKRYDEAIGKLEKVIQHKNPENYANWVTIDRPWSERLLKEILRDKAVMQKAQ